MIMMHFSNEAAKLGVARLKIVEVFAVLMDSGSAYAAEKIIENNVIKIALDMLLKYPFNNLLHR